MEWGQKFSNWLQQWFATHSAGAPQRSQCAPMGPSRQRGGGATQSPPAQKMLMRLSYGHSARSLRLSVMHLSGLRAHHNTQRRLLIPIDLPFFHVLPCVVLSTCSGEMVQEARARGYEIEFVCWQTKSGVPGDYIAMRAQRGDQIVLLRGTGMQRHVACVLRLAKEKKLAVLTDNIKPVWQECEKC